MRIQDVYLQRLPGLAHRLWFESARASTAKTHCALRLARDVLQEQPVRPENSRFQIEIGVSRHALLQRPHVHFVLDEINHSVTVSLCV